MGDGLSFPGVFGAVAGIEETSLNRDEGIVVVAVETGLCQPLLMRFRVKESRKRIMAAERWTLKEALRLDYLFSHPPEWLYMTGIASGSAMET